MACEVTAAVRQIKIVRRDDGYWVTMASLPGCEDAGPYPTQREAKEARTGLVQTITTYADHFLGRDERDDDNVVLRPRSIQQELF